MAGGLSISKIELSGRRRGLPSPMDGHRDIWFDVTITVENPGNVPLHVISELRSISYDAAQRVLTLHLAEAKPGPAAKDAPTFTLPTPTTVTVEPHGEAKITIKIPAILKELRRVPGESFALQQTDIRDMTTIRCEIAASKEPMGNFERVDARKLRTRLAKWGKTIAHEAAVKPDTRD
jgi:hypothetical protein